METLTQPHKVEDRKAGCGETLALLQTRVPSAPSLGEVHKGSPFGDKLTVLMDGLTSKMSEKQDVSKNAGFDPSPRSDLALQSSVM